MEPKSSLPHLKVPATCPYPEPDHSSPCPHPTSWRSTLIISSHLCLGLPSNLFPSAFTTKTLEHISSLHTCYMPLPSQSSRFAHPYNIGWGIPITKLLFMQFSPLPCYLVPLRPKYSPHQTILKHSHPPFFPQCKRPSFTPIQNNRQYYNSVYLNLYILG